MDVRQRVVLFTTSEAKFKSFCKGSAGGMIIKMTKDQFPVWEPSDGRNAWSLKSPEAAVWVRNLIKTRK